MARGAESSRLIAAWRTNNRATVYLIEHLPPSVWWSRVPGIPRLTVCMIAAHIHNSRCRWIKSLGAPHGVEVPRLVDLRRVRPAQLVKALSRSGDGMVSLIAQGNVEPLKSTRFVKPEWLRNRPIRHHRPCRPGRYGYGPFCP